MRLQKIGCILAGCILVGGLSGCGLRGSADVPVQEQDGKGQEASVVELPDAKADSAWEITPLLAIDDVENTNIAGLWQERAVGCMVQLQAGELVGSGVLWRAEGTTVYVATAAHILAQAGDGIGVVFADGTEFFSEDYYICQEMDLAFVAVQMEEMAAQRESYLLVNGQQEAYDNLRPDDGIILMASAKGVAMDAFEGTVIDTWCYTEDFEQYMMYLKVHSYDGMSGGGVFDLQGHFLGIFCGGNKNGEGAAVPLALVESAYENFIKVLDLSY